MINKWLITGDCHGNYSRFFSIHETIPENECWGVICLGDFSINYYLNKMDKKSKYRLNNKYSKLNFYCVRGNHEQRPELIPTMELVYDSEVEGEVYCEKDFPNIRYFVDGGIYSLNGRKVLTIGGAYSVDKYYRLQNGAQWFENELLTEDEMNAIEKSIIGKKFDFILTHTCPISWEPTDLFLGCVNQSTVDKSMEIWMDRIKDKIIWQHWLFGHFHADRMERPYVEMFFRDVEPLENICARWERYRETGELDYWLDKSPNFYMYEVN